MQLQSTLCNTSVFIFFTREHSDCLYRPHTYSKVLNSLNANTYQTVWGYEAGGVCYRNLLLW